MDKFYGLGSISREDEQYFPDFENHEDAIKWFKKRFGERFAYETVEKVGEQICYFYVLIVDKEPYDRGREILARDGHMAGTEEFMRSYQSIQIMEDGFIHVVH